MQHTALRVLQNSGIVAGTEIFSKVLGLVVVVFAARSLGAADLGVLAFAVGLTSRFGVLIRFGFDTLIVREVARDQSQAGGCWGPLLYCKRFSRFWPSLLFWLLPLYSAAVR